MKTNSTSKCQKSMAAMAVCLAIGWLCWCGESVGLAQTAPADLSPGLMDVVKLAQAHISDDIISSYIKNSGTAYSLSADDIIYLSSQGVSQNIIAVLQQARPAAPVTPGGPMPMPTTPPPAMPAMPPPQPYGSPIAPAEAYMPPVAPPGSEINLIYFQDQLRPYGIWVNVPPYGPVWRPNDAIQIGGWRPYFNQGYWEYTDAGWFWHSDVAYGDIVFHYGRWIRDPGYGWVWVPGYDWAPAWVSWRHAEGFAGWAPLPPAARFEVGVGLMFRGGLAVDVDFGLAPDDYVFVGYDHFLEHGYLRWVERDRAPVLFRGSLVMNDYRIGLDGRLVVEGLGRDRVAAFSHRPVVVEKVVIRDSRIERGRELEKTRAVERVREIQSRPAGDPLRRSLDSRDALRRPEDARGPGGPGARNPEAGTRGGPGESRDTRGGRDSRDPSGGGSGRGQ